MVLAANLGFPRIGAKRELKKATEDFWKGNITEKKLLDEAANIRKKNWGLQKAAGIDVIPSNDFSFYDHVLDMIATVGAVPERYNFKGKTVDLKTYFAMARGSQGKGEDVTAMEMTKWLDTNYHYMVPELHAGQEFALSSSKAVDEYNEAKKQGMETRPVILGPVSFLLLGKMKDGGNALSLLPNLLPVYQELLENLAAAGAEWVQIDEPCLVLDLKEEQKNAYKEAYAALAKSGKIMLATYFGDLRDNLALALKLPVAGLHIDLVRAREQLEDVLAQIADSKTLSIGIIDGRNIWKTDLEKALVLAKRATNKHNPDNLQIAPSCSLLHSPVDLETEDELDEELKSWLAFARQKLQEVSILTRALNKGRGAIKEELDDNVSDIAARRTSSRVHNRKVKDRVNSATADMLKRKSPYSSRKSDQQNILNLPLLPTTTIGSFPQTAEVRQKRAQFKKGDISKAEYEKFLKSQIEKCIKFQEKIGLDVLVHGEFERNDMVEYFGEQLNGFLFTKNGWVQSYGSRCVKPPIIFGDVSRDEPMTTDWTKYAQNLTEKPMKGMLTGPVTILQWSFVRDDQPRSETCKQIAFAIRDEVQDLEAEGIKVIQIDEAALREGLPLRKSDWAAYLKWAVDSFRITSSAVRDETQIHTHMCYSEFNDIIAAVADMDADVISIETSRSQMELLDAFVNFKYPNEIGPGVYDIHSPRVPAEQEIEELLHKALEVLSPRQVWVNPDCGLKTRGWEEVEEALKLMVEATNHIREELSDDNNSQKASA